MSTLYSPTVWTAHEQFKSNFWMYVSAAMVVSVLAHYAVLSRADFANLPDYSVNSDVLEEIALEDHERREFQVPPAPERIGRPAVPIMSTNVELSDDITIGEIDFDEIPVKVAPPSAPAALAAVQSDQPNFTPYEIRPALLNGDQVQRELLGLYPSKLRMAGIGGVTTLWIFIDETGAVRNTKIVASSGVPELDVVAQEVMSRGRFSPAFNRDRAVPVWIQMPVTFETERVREAG